MRTRLSIFALMVSLLLLLSCSKKTLEWDVDITAPLVKTELSIANLLPDSMLQTDEESFVSLVLDRELFSASTASIAEFPDSLFEFSLDIPQNGALAPGLLFFYKDELQKLAIAPVELNYAGIYSGNLTFQAINPFDKPIEITYKMPSATKAGVSFNETVVIPPGTASAAPYTANISMAGYTIDMRGPEENTSNRFMTRMTARISPFATDSARALSGKLFIKIKFTDIVVDYMKGYFGSLSSSYGPESVKTELFSGVTGGELQLDKCTASIDIENGFGADARLQVLAVKAVNSTAGREVALQSPVIGNPVNITRAAETGAGHGVVPNKVSIDLSASNIADMITAFPDRFEYAANLSLNPLGNISSGNDFAYRIHPFSARIHFDLPLRFSAKDLTLQKKIKYDLSGRAADIHSATLHLIADNSFPLSATITLQVENDAGEAIMEIPNDGATIAPAALLQDGVTELRHTVIHFKLDEKQTEILKNNKMMRLTAVFNTLDNQKIKIYDTYKIDLKITTDFNYGVTVNK